MLKPICRKRKRQTDKGASPPARQVDAISSDDFVTALVRDRQQSVRHVEPDRHQVGARRVHRWVLRSGFGFPLSRACSDGRERKVPLALPFEDAPAPEVFAIASPCVEDESSRWFERVEKELDKRPPRVPSPREIGRDLVVHGVNVFRFERSRHVRGPSVCRGGVAEIRSWESRFGVKRANTRLGLPVPTGAHREDESRECLLPVAHAES